MRLAKPLDAGIVTTHTAEQAYDLVLAHAGCSKQRDIIDIRIIEETQNGTATYIGSVTKGAENAPGLIDLPADVKPEGSTLSLIHISEPTRLGMISYAVFCLKKKKARKKKKKKE